jgi:signal transduction histidine kinase/ActR/RegA family two-component response regulator
MITINKMSGQIIFITRVIGILVIEKIISINLLLASNANNLRESQLFSLTNLLCLIAILFILFITSQYFRLKKGKKKIIENIKSKDNEIKTLLEKVKNLSVSIDERIKEKTIELEQKLIERQDIDNELKIALKREEEANFLKNAFLSNMSHEIRTPLNGIIGFSSLLEAELSRMENQELFEYAIGIQQSGERLLHLLNNIIDISRIEANDMEVKLESCSIPPIITQVSELYSFKANEKGLRLNIQTLDTPPALTDERILSRVLTDIIDNAIKYTEKGFVNVSSGFDIETRKVFIRIKDTGIGIDSAYLPNIFQAFRQESLGYSRAYQGAGLGLPLAHKLIQLMNGEITVDSIKGIGTTITVNLPVELSTVSLKSAKNKVESFITPENNNSTNDIHIFIVEDDRMNRLVLKSMLQGKYKLTMAEDGEETLKIIEKRHNEGGTFDIMLFDINLPVPWDGIELMKVVKEKYKNYLNIPFVAQTAYAMTGDKERLLESGFDDYISKPLNQNRLISIINSNLRKFKKY